MSEETKNTAQEEETTETPVTEETVENEPEVVENGEAETEEIQVEDGDEEASQDDKKDSKSKTSFFGKKKKEKDKFEQQIEELTDRLKRNMAEFDNFRKRTEKEKAAMAEFHKGNRKEGLRLQEEFAAAFREEYKEKDHCPCKKACRYHGNCKECVAIHRAHQEHVPNCMRELINKKLKGLSELTEHTIAYEIEPPKEILRKEAQ